MLIKITPAFFAVKMKFTKLRTGKTTITVKIFGGLGNQMFQYAAAKSLAVSANAELKMDISSFTNQLSSETSRYWALDIFKNIDDVVLNPGRDNPVLSKFYNEFIYRGYKFVLNKFGWLNRNYVIERNFFFSPIGYTGRKIYLDGYWQSYKYFSKNNDLIKHRFDLSYLDHEIALQSFIRKIRTTKSVSLHVRRGDYITNVNASKLNELCTLNFYHKAIAEILRLENSKVHFFIFSDDIPWCKENLNIREDHLFIETTQDAHDLYLMSLCRYNIIANSTFSWWAAWLNNNPDKIVIAPKNWHKRFKNLDDLIPSTWIQID